MGTLKSEAKTLLQALGGEENLVSLTHCATRLRFELKDTQQARLQEIESLPSVKGTFTNAGQFQVIIGNEVSRFYQELMALRNPTEKQVTSPSKQASFIEKGMGFLAETFAPIIPAIILAGVLKGLVGILEPLHLSLNIGTISLEALLTFASQVLFSCLPIGITWSISRRSKTTEIFGIVLGAYLVAHSYLPLQPTMTQGLDYSGQVFPALFAGILLAQLEIFWRKKIPTTLAILLVPILSFIPTIALTEGLLGPLGWQIGLSIAHGTTFLLTESLRGITGGLFGGLYSLSVMSGLHHLTTIIDLQSIASTGETFLWPMIALANISQGSATLGYYYAHRKHLKNPSTTLSAVWSAYLGVTELALFGINVKEKVPFLAAIIGGGLAGTLATIFRVEAHSIGIGGLPAILSIKDSSAVAFLGITVIAILVPLGCTYVFYKWSFRKKRRRVILKPFSDTEKKEFLEILSPLDGTVKPLSSAADPVFATGMMGQGLVIEPTTNQLVAPIDGTISVLFPTKHTIGLLSPDGLEILLHIGMETVQLNGQGFTSYVQQGQTVQSGDVLIEFDVDMIEQAGFITETPVIITNSEDYVLEFPADLPQKIAHQETLFTVHKQASM